RFTISEYMAGRRNLTQEEARVAANVLVRELQVIRQRLNDELLEEFDEKVRRSEFQQRLVTYRGFDAFGVLIHERFGSVATAISPIFASAAGDSGAATCQAIVTSNSITTWQGASQKGVAHKVKEQVGRMGLCCLSYETLRGGVKRFSWRPEIAR